MTEDFIDELELQLRAAERRRVRLAAATLPAVRPAALGGIVSIAVAVVVVALLLTAGPRGVVTPRGSSAAPEAAVAALGQAARSAAEGSLAPALTRGEGWYVEAVEDDALQPGLRAFYSSPVVQKWFSNGEEVGRQGGSGWQGMSAGALGFADWDPGFDATAAQRLPTTAGGMLALLGSMRMGPGYLPYNQPDGDADPDSSHGAFTELAQLTVLLAEMPLRPAARAAAFEAIARLPGLYTVPDARTAVGRRGIGVAIDSPPIRELPMDGVSQPARRYEFELVFNPSSGRVLGWETRTIATIPQLGLRPGAIVFAWGLVETGVAPMSRVMAMLNASRGVDQPLRRRVVQACAHVGRGARDQQSLSPACRAAEVALRRVLTAQETALTARLRALAQPR